MKTIQQLYMEKYAIDLPGFSPDEFAAGKKKLEAQLAREYAALDNLANKPLAAAAKFEESMARTTKNIASGNRRAMLGFGALGLAGAGLAGYGILDLLRRRSKNKDQRIE